MRLDPLHCIHPVSGAVLPVVPSLLREIYLAPKPGEWPLAGHVDAVEAPWAASLAVAPERVEAAVAQALRALAEAAPGLDPAQVDMSLLPECRVRRHLAALHRHWQAMGGALPDDLAVVRHVLGCGAGEALEALPLLDLPDDPFASAAEQALSLHLRAHHGLAPEAATTGWLARQPQGATDGALAHLQRSLLEQDTAATSPDASLTFYSLRDSLQEARFAAALARRMLEDGRAARPSDIGLLLLDDPARLRHLAEAFAAQGVPLSGLPAEWERRDLAGEVVNLALTALRPPAPAMALASLATSALMPWPAATGALIARQLMEGKQEPKAAELLGGQGAALWEALRGGAVTGRQLAFKLGLLAETLPLRLGLEAAREAARARLRLVQAAAGEGAPDWAALMRLAKVQSPEAPPPARNVEGVSLLSAGETPWRGARHLIVTGFAEGAYPRPSSASPFFLDSELELIARTTGTRMPGRAERGCRPGDRGRHLARRQGARMAGDGGL